MFIHTSGKESYRLNRTLPNPPLPAQRWSMVHWSSAWDPHIWEAVGKTETPEEDKENDSKSRKCDIQ